MSEPRQQKSLSEVKAPPDRRKGATPRLSRNGKRIGRPPAYSEETAEAVLQLIAQARPFGYIEKLPGMPSAQTVLRWMDPESTTFRSGFRERYARAREMAADLLAAEALAIADDPTGDWITRFDKKAGETIDVPDYENVQRSRLRVDTRKWAAAKLHPSRYGDKVTTELSGPQGGPIVTASVVTDLRAGLDLIRAKMRANVGESSISNPAELPAPALPALEPAA